MQFVTPACNSLQTRKQGEVAPVVRGMNKQRSLIAVIVIALLSVAGVLVYRVAYAKEAPAYRFATVQRGNIQSTVSATGTLNAVTTVSVGTQVSGHVSALLVDFRSEERRVGKECRSRWSPYH